MLDSIFLVFFNQYHRFRLEIIEKNSAKITGFFLSWLMLLTVKQAKELQYALTSMYGYRDQIPILAL